jgi:hypothetical protein
MKIKKRKKNARLALFKFGVHSKQVFTRAQRALVKKHGTPAEFAAATYKAVPGMISMDEARKAIDEYAVEWNAAA